MSDDLEQIRQMALMREVDEEVRNDKIKEIWNRYKAYLFGLVCAILFITISFEGVKYWQNQLVLRDSNAYIEATSLATLGQTDEAIAKFTEIIKNDDTGYAHLALLNTVPLLEKQGKNEQAISTLYSIINNDSIVLPLRNAATVALCFRLIDTKDANTNEIIKMLTPIAKDTSSWSNIANNILLLIQNKEQQ